MSPAFLRHRRCCCAVKAAGQGLHLTATPTTQMMLHCRFLVHEEKTAFSIVHASPAHNSAPDVSHAGTALASQRWQSPHTALPGRTSASQVQVPEGTDACSNMLYRPDLSPAAESGLCAMTKTYASAATLPLAATAAHNVTCQAEGGGRAGDTSWHGAARLNQAARIEDAFKPDDKRWQAANNLHAAAAVHSHMGSEDSAKAGSRSWRSVTHQQPADVQTASLAALQRAAVAQLSWAETTLHGQPGSQQSHGFLNAAVVLETFNRQKQAELLQPDQTEESCLQKNPGMQSNLPQGTDAMTWGGCQYGSRPGSRHGSQQGSPAGSPSSNR